MILQSQIWRYTNCRCLIESPWDIVALAIFLILAIAGFFWIMESVFKLCTPTSKKERAMQHFRALEDEAEYRGKHIMLARLKYIKENLL